MHSSRIRIARLLTDPGVGSLMEPPTFMGPPFHRTPQRGTAMSTVTYNLQAEHAKAFLVTIGNPRSFRMYCTTNDGITPGLQLHQLCGVTHQREHLSSFICRDNSCFRIYTWYPQWRLYTDRNRDRLKTSIN